MSAKHAHASSSGSRRVARVAVFTVSDTRVEEDDTSGRTIRERLERDGHVVCRRAILPDEPERVREAVREAIDDDACDGVLLTGGTGISARDSTYEAIVGLLDKRLDGFGELFRRLSWDEIGAAAMLSRAFGGVASGRFVFVMPGATAAVVLAMDRLILPELAHLIAELRKDA